MAEAEAQPEGHPALSPGCKGTEAMAAVAPLAAYRQCDLGVLALGGRATGALRSPAPVRGVLKKL